VSRRHQFAWASSGRIGPPVSKIVRLVTGPWRVYAADISVPASASRCAWVALRRWQHGRIVADRPRNCRPLRCRCRLSAGGGTFNANGCRPRMSRRSISRPVAHRGGSWPYRQPILAAGSACRYGRRNRVAGGVSPAIPYLRRGMRPTSSQFEIDELPALLGAADAPPGEFERPADRPRPPSIEKALIWRDVELALREAHAGPRRAGRSTSARHFRCWPMGKIAAPNLRTTMRRATSSKCTAPQRLPHWNRRQTSPGLLGPCPVIGCISTRAMWGRRLRGVGGELYPEEVLVCLAAAASQGCRSKVDRGSPRAISSRANHSRRAAPSTSAAASIATARILALDGRFVFHDQGRVYVFAPTRRETGWPDLCRHHAAGPLSGAGPIGRWGRFASPTRRPGGTYRAPGRYESTWLGAGKPRVNGCGPRARLGLDPIEVRRRNLIGRIGISLSAAVRGALGTEYRARLRRLRAPGSTRRSRPIGLDERTARGVCNGGGRGAGSRSAAGPRDIFVSWNRRAGLGPVSNRACCRQRRPRRPLSEGGSPARRRSARASRPSSRQNLRGCGARSSRPYPPRRARHPRPPPIAFGVRGSGHFRVARQPVRTGEATRQAAVTWRTKALEIGRRAAASDAPEELDYRGRKGWSRRTGGRPGRVDHARRDRPGRSPPTSKLRGEREAWSRGRRLLFLLPDNTHETMPYGVHHRRWWPRSIATRRRRSRWSAIWWLTTSCRAVNPDAGGRPDRGRGSRPGPRAAALCWGREVSATTSAAGAASSGPHSPTT